MTEVSWLAVIIATALSFMLGGLWYSKRMFGAKWAEGAGLDLESEDAGKHAVKALSVQFVGTFLLAWLLGALVAAGDWLVVAVTVATVAFILAAGGLFHRNSHYSIMVEAAFSVVMAVIIIVVHLVL